MLAVGPVTAEGHLEIVPLPVHGPPVVRPAAMARDSDHVAVKDKAPGSKVPAVPSSGFNRLQLSLNSFLILNGLAPVEEDEEGRAAREARRAEEEALAAEQDRAAAEAARWRPGQPDPGRRRGLL